jgi:hypothetical protein
VFRSLHRRNEAKTVSEAILWLRRKHPEVAQDPTQMAKAVMLETQRLRQQQEEIRSSSLGAAVRHIKDQSKVIAGSAAVSAGSTRYDNVPEGSLIEKRLQRMKQAQERAMKASMDAAQGPAGQ